jgi:hypothetical protein
MITHLTRHRFKHGRAHSPYSSLAFLKPHKSFSGNTHALIFLSFVYKLSLKQYRKTRRRASRSVGLNYSKSLHACVHYNINHFSAIFDLFELQKIQKKSNFILHPPINTPPTVEAHFTIFEMILYMS